MRTGLQVGAADDQFERQAERVAGQVANRIQAGVVLTPADKSDSIGAPPASGSVGRIIARDAQVGAQGGAVDAHTEHQIQSARSGGRPLDEGTRATMEGAFGTDFSSVRVHDDQRAGELSTRIQAKAFTIGSDIFFNGGAPNTSTRSGQELLAHELTHTIQQSGQASAQRVLHRRFFDQDEDWMAASKVSGFLGITKGRSKQMKAVDLAVDRWNDALKLGDVTYMILASQSVIDSIMAWRGSKKDSATEDRAAEVHELEVEARAWNAKVTQWKADIPARRAKHDQDRATVRAWVDEGAAQDADLRLRNACEWVRSGKTKFYLVSETPDSIERGAAINGKALSAMPADTLCYFPDYHNGIGDLWSPIAIYNGLNYRDEKNVDVDEDGVGTKGWNVTGDCIVITEEGVADGKAAAFGTLKHEVQHDADKNKGEELSAGIEQAATDKTAAEGRATALNDAWILAYGAWEASKSSADSDATTQAQAAYETFTQSDDYVLRDAKVKSEQALRGYKTEYRAHFYEGDPKFEAEAHDLANLITKESLQWTRRQWVIFKNIRRNYDYVEKAWGDVNAVPTAVETAFRASIAAYRNPDTEGFNKYDSARVDDLYNLLHLVPDGTSDAKDAKVAAVLQQVRELDKTDLDYLLDAAQSVMFNQKIRKHLTGAALAAVLEEMEDISTGQSIASLFS